MASTYTGQDAINMVRKYIKDIPLSGASVDVLICDTISSTMYTTYPWRFTLGTLTAIILTDIVQDYTVANADFYRLVRARINQTNLTPDEYKELDIVEKLPPLLATTAATKDGFSQIAYDHITNKLRLDKAASIAGGVTMQIEGEYQKLPTKITALTSTYWFPDHYFPVFVEGVQWKAYQFSDDERAGTVQYDDQGRRLYTGQLGIFMGSLLSMVQAEDWGVGQPFSFPPNALGITRGGYPGTQNKQ